MISKKGATVREGSGPRGGGTRPRPGGSVRRRWPWCGTLVLVASLGYVAGASGQPPVDKLPPQAQKMIETLLGVQKLPFSIVAEPGSEIELAQLAGQDYTARPLPAGEEPNEDQIMDDETIRIVMYTRNPTCYIIYHRGSPIEYCPSS